MTKPEETTPKHEQLELSQELLYLLQWLGEHHIDALKKMVDAAVNSGFKQAVKDDFEDFQANDQEALFFSVGEFLGLMDALLLESLYEQSIRTVKNKKLLPAFSKIDNSVCDNQTLVAALEHIQADVNVEPTASRQDVLLKELLNRWSPSKKSAIN